MRKKIKRLAIFGGRPAFKKMLYVGAPNIPNQHRLIFRIKDILKRRRLTNNGPVVKEFEKRIQRLAKVKHCIAMCNGTTALEILSRAIGLKGEVIVPAFTFVATAHMLQWQEIVPVFCDIDPKTYAIDAAKLESLITPKTTGIIGVHPWGTTCNVEALSEIAKRRNLKLIFDASHSLGCSYKGRMIGGFGEAEVFSFHATKFINSFEGGAVVTNDDELAKKIRLMKNFGFAGMDNVIYLGINGKMNEISAAMGVTSIESIENFIEINRKNYLMYKKCLNFLAGVRLKQYDPVERNNFQYIIIEIDKEKAGIERDVLMKILHAENIIARRYFYPACHRMEPYRSYFPNAGLILPETERISERVLCLPTGTTIKLKDIVKICDLIKFAIEHQVAIKKEIKKTRFGVPC